jgi:hypothetical protein
MRSRYDGANMRERSVGLDLGLCLKRFGSTGNNGSTESRTLATGAIIAKKECANKPFRSIGGVRERTARAAT